MASVLSGAASPAATAPLSASAPAARVAPMLRMSGFLFLLYMMVQMVEYGAMHIYLPALKAVRFSTLVSYFLFAMVLWRYKGEIFASRQAKLFGTFVIFTGVGILWAVVRSYVPLALRFHIDYFGLFVISAFIIDSRQRGVFLSLAFAAIIVLLVATNRNMLGQDIRFGSFAASYFMGDGNDFGWGLIVMLPFTLYLMVGDRRFLTRMWGLAGFAVAVVGIIGTESRGATLALAGGMLLFWATVAKRKLLFAGVIAAGVTAVVLLAPPSYFNRLNTLAHTEDDNSAQGRLRAWKAARQMALDYPLGVGANNFNSAYGRFYIPADTSGWAANRWMSTHSCYFKVLAEYGYPGLILFLSILFHTFRDNVRSAQRLRAVGKGAAFDPEWPLLLNVSLLGYSICGFFLGGIIYPHLYLIAGLTVATTRVSLQAVATAAASGETAPVAPASRPAIADRVMPAALRPRATPAGGRYF